MPPFDNVQYQNDSTPTFSVDKLNFSAAQDDYSHTSLTNTNVSVSAAAAQNNTNNTIATNDTSHTTYSGDNSPASYQANSPLNNSDLNQHRHENSDEYLTSASALSMAGDHGNSTSDEASTVNLLNMDSHYNSNNYYANSNSTSGYEDGKFLFDYLE